MHLRQSIYYHENCRHTCIDKSIFFWKWFPNLTGPDTQDVGSYARMQC